MRPEDLLYDAGHRILAHVRGGRLKASAQPNGQDTKPVAAHDWDGYQFGDELVDGKNVVFAAPFEADEPSPAACFVLERAVAGTASMRDRPLVWLHPRFDLESVLALWQPRKERAKAKPVASVPAIKTVIEALATQLGKTPSKDDSERQAKRALPENRVVRSRVRIAHEALFGKLSPGPRGNKPAN